MDRNVSPCRRSMGPHPRQRSSIATAISNGNLDQISRVWAPATATTTMTCRSLLRLLLIRIFWYLVGDLVIRGEFRHCYYQRTEKDWTDRSLRVWVDHQQQPRSGCTSRLRLKSLSWMGPLSISSAHSMNARKCVHAQKPYSCQAFAHESSKVGKRGKIQERLRPRGWWKERKNNKTKISLKN